ncbi:uncharacterized protein LOC143551251 isoform X2 [Bidens hawaiensis]|uniref:uncharacterized protein LOC143551251 isoform X2 n=1 Tax=Bidens hawaiensis TaxID=980011 RepID=UPI00404A20F0
MEESKEDVQSDGSYELVNFDDYASEPERLDSEGVDSGSKDLSDASSYDLLCSDMSDTLVLTDDEAFYNNTVSQDNASDKENQEQDDMGFGDGINSDSEVQLVLVNKNNASDEENEEQEDEEQKDVEDDMGFGNGINSDSEGQPVLLSANKGKKRDLTAMLYMSSNPDPFVPPAHLNIKQDLKEVAKNHITRYLPAKALVKCRKVSKEWNQWLSGPFCAHEQSQFFRKTSGFFQCSSYNNIGFISLEKSACGVPSPSLSFIPQQVSIKSSCNGLLLCQSIDNEDELYVCNPANREWIFLPPSQSYHCNPKLVLAFEPSSLNFEPHYQVICLFSLLDTEEQKIVYFDIYDSETKAWRLSDELCSDLDASEVESESILVNGVAYWETKDGGLLAFDLKNEIHSVQKLPFGKSDGALTNIHGEICYVRARYESYRKSCVLEVYGDGFMSLKKTVIVPDDNLESAEFLDCEVLSNSCDDVIVLVVKGSWGQNRLYVYHMKEDKARRVGILGHFEKLFPYVNSLVSIRGSG